MKTQENLKTLDYCRSGADIHMILTYFLMKRVCMYIYADGTTVLGCVIVFIRE